MEICAAPLALGYALGRVGCFLVNDDYGIPSSVPWAMKFPNGLPPTTVMNLRAMIGEAVPPLFTEMHGRVLVRVLEGTVARAMRATDPRVVSARRSLGLD